MNKFGYQPMPVLLRAEPNDARSNTHSAKILRVVATLGTVFALCGVIAICLIAFKAFPPGTLESKASANVPILPETKVPPIASANQDDGIGTVLPDTNQPHGGSVPGDHSIVDQTSNPALNPASTPAPVPKPETSESDNGFLKEDRPEAAQINVGRHLSEPVRKNLEKERRQAERKRSRLEEMYQQHAISTEAYKKGEEKYRSAIERYRREMNANSEPKN